MSDTERLTDAAKAVETEEEVRDLLRTAGTREPVPREDLEALRSVARAEWQSMVHAERKAVKNRDLRLVALAASLIVAVAAGWFWMTRGPVGAATVEFVQGRVEVAGERRVDVGVGTVLGAGVRIETADEGGTEPARVALRMAGGQLRLDGGTTLVLESDDRLTLERGAVYFDSGRAVRHDGSAVEVVTSYGTIRDIGTQFEVRLDGEGATLSVRVREGAVTLQSGGEVRSANRGEALEVSGDGSIALTQLAVDDASWHWAQTVAPPFTIEGETLAAFLEWASRETGWEVRYADPELEAEAGTIRLKGTIEDLTAAEAVSMVLPGSALDHEVVGGVLRVRRRGDG